MAAVVNRLKPGLVHIGVTLGCGKRCVAEQFLNGSEVAPTGKKMGGKAMAQGMWRGGIGKTQKPP